MLGPFCQLLAGRRTLIMNLPLKSFDSLYSTPGTVYPELQLVLDLAPDLVQDLVPDLAPDLGANARHKMCVCVCGNRCFQRQAHSEIANNIRRFAFAKGNCKWIFAIGTCSLRNRVWTVAFGFVQVFRVACNILKTLPYSLQAQAFHFGVLTRS